MDPVTHFLTGATLSRAGFNRKSALTTVTMTLAAEAADLDVLAYVKGSAYGFMQHRGITHTVFAVPAMAAIAVAIVWGCDALYRRFRRTRRPAPERRWGWLYFAACIAALSHILLDFTNNYGIRPLFPLIRQWYAWDIVFIFEPLMFAALLAALVLPGLFALVSREIGERQSGPRGRGAAVAALLFILVLWGVRDVEHRRAVAAMQAIDFQGGSSLRVAAFPYMLNPFRWAGVAETADAYISVPVDSLHSEVDPGERAQTYYKPQPSEAAQAARNTDFGRFYTKWARFPLLEDEQLTPAADSGAVADAPGMEPVPAHMVHLLDVRFLYPDSRRHPLVAYILLDSDLRPVEEGFERSPQQR
jgi:inner membrane protein